MKTMKKLIDIGANLTDPMFKGVYHGKSCHPEDLASVIKRSFETHVEKIILTSGQINETLESLELCKQYKNLYTTVGYHPTRSTDFLKAPDENLKVMAELLENNSKLIVAIGEFGLDYARLEFSDKESQLEAFRRHLDFSLQYKKPLFLHCREAFDDFIRILKEKNYQKQLAGVVHSFDGTIEQAKSFIDEGFYIGLNGCSLRTDESLLVVKEIPIERIMLETDAPWCEIKPTHPSYKYVQTHFEKKKKEKHEEGLQVKNRNEPQNIIQVLEVVSAIKNMDKSEVAEITTKNTENLFFS